MIKKIFYVVIALFSIMILIVTVKLIIELSNHTKIINALTINDINLSTISDGTYRGHYDVIPVIVDVDVAVKNHQITNIDIVKHFNGQGSKAEAITEKIIANQSLEVDIISGATSSSKVILKAVEDALTTK